MVLFYLLYLLIVFLFLTNFTIREANSLFGRGLDTLIIAQLFYYNLAPMMALSVPMSVFVAVAMACSRLAADSEITILRSSGVSLISILVPLVLVAFVVALAMFYFNNTILPEYNVRSSVLMREISRLKPTVNLYPNTFTEIKNVQLYVRDIDDRFSENTEQKIKELGQEYSDYPVDHLFHVIIYDKRDVNKMKTIFAKEGFVYLNPKKEVFEFILKNGEIHEIDNQNKVKYPRSFFNKTIFILEASDYVISKNDNDVAFKSNRQKSANELLSSWSEENSRKLVRYTSMLQDFENSELTLGQSKFRQLLYNKMNHDAYLKNSEILNKDSIKTTIKKLKSFEDFKNSDLSIYKNFLSENLSRAESMKLMQSSSDEEIRDIEGEFYKKLSIPFASIVFVLIGAPLGMMTKKGQTSSAAVICLLVLIVYYICLVLGEENADDGYINPILGIWSGNIFGLVIASWGIFLLKKEKSIADIKFSFSFLSNRKKNEHN